MLVIKLENLEQMEMIFKYDTPVIAWSSRIDLFPVGE
jgi:hypothetical protein